jgi:hypothetical protein
MKWSLGERIRLPVWKPQRDFARRVDEAVEVSSASGYDGRMKPRVYVETTVPSYLTAWPSRDLVVAAHQQLTKEWWRTRRGEFDLFISQFVLDEAAAGDADAARERLEAVGSLPLLDVTESVSELAAVILQEGVIPRKAARDAAHIAVSAVHGIEFLMTWNCAHIANAMIVKKIQAICAAEGFTCPVLCTPEELMGIDHD